MPDGVAPYFYSGIILYVIQVLYLIYSGIVLDVLRYNPYLLLLSSGALSMRSMNWSSFGVMMI